jgi:hypothetical protein
VFELSPGWDIEDLEEKDNTEDGGECGENVISDSGFVRSAEGLDRLELGT